MLLETLKQAANIHLLSLPNTNQISNNPTTRL
jgi:hypothetical protein